VQPIPHLRRNTPFPALDSANDDVGGLLAFGADLSPGRLLDAYSRGIFPWYSRDEPILWWSPDPRMVLDVDAFHVSHSLARRRRTAGFELRTNTAFERVITTCAQQPRAGQAGTWIMPEMIAAYVRLHALGFAHSIETWRDGVLVGGLYGVAIDHMFFGESMFAHESDASKVALAHLIDQLKAAEMPCIDCQQQTKHLASLGAKPESRAQFAARLRMLISEIRPWPVEKLRTSS
jgi:leucyl/phenylalanyl-tRNA---protein transferase